MTAPSTRTTPATRPLEATIRVGAPLTERPLPDAVFGHFLESAFFGNIEGGVFDEGSPLSVQEEGPLRGCRRDVIDACRELGLGVVRWPGGNFTSPYRWEDGTGPRDARPRTLELAWGSEESNRFGTPEFLAWCAAVGAEPYLAHSARSVDDAVRWVEYTNYTGDTTLTRRRREDGLTTPADVRTWGLGNEVYGAWQMGHRSVEQYVADAREHARFMDLVSGPLSFVAVGSERPGWTEAVVEGLGDVVDLVSLHVYGASLHALSASEDEFFQVAAQSAYVERAVVEQSDLIARTQHAAGHARPLSIAIDEWNMRHLEPQDWDTPEPDPRGGTRPRPSDATAQEQQVPLRPGLHVNRYSSRTLADALYSAGVFHVVHRAAGRTVPVGMTNTVNLVNANGLLEVRPEGVVRSANYHVWDLYSNHVGRVPLGVEVDGPARSIDLRLGDEPMPEGTFRTVPSVIGLLDVTATRSDDGRLHVVVINRSPTEAVTGWVEVGSGPPPTTAVVRTIGDTTDDLFAVNRLGTDAVTLSAPRTVELTDGSWTFAPHAVTALELLAPDAGR